MIYQLYDKYEDCTKAIVRDWTNQEAFLSVWELPDGRSFHCFDRDYETAMANLEKHRGGFDAVQ